MFDSEKNFSPKCWLVFLVLLMLAWIASSPVQAMKTRPTGWSQTYNGGENVNDEGKAVAVDAQGNVYVVGVSRLTPSSGGSPHNQFILVKYDPQGVRQWVAHNDPDNWYLGLPVGVAVDNSRGLVYVGLSTWNVIGFRMSDGARRWVGETTVSPEVGPAKVMALDGEALGHVYVGGNGPLHKYSIPIIFPEDSLTITHRDWYGPSYANALAFFGDSVFTTGGYNGGAWTRKVDAEDGGIIWENWFYEGNYNNNPVAIAVDSLGDPVVVYKREYLRSIPYITHIRAIKFIGASTGPEPSTRWQTLLPADTSPAGMVLDSQDNVIIAGSARSPRNPPYSDLYVMKLDPLGSQLWALYDNEGHKYIDGAVAVATDIYDAIVFTGTSAKYDPAGSIFSTITKAYSTSAQYLWSEQYGPFPDRGNNYPAGLAVKGQTAYVCGTVGPASNIPNNDIFILKSGPRKIPKPRP